MIRFRMQLMQEEFNLVSYSWIFIFKKHANIYNFSLKFEHIIQNEMCDNHESLSSNMGLGVMKKNEYIFCSFIQNIRETVEEVSDCNNNVSFHAKINMRSQELEEKLNIRHTYLRRNTHKFAKS